MKSKNDRVVEVKSGLTPVFDNDTWGSKKLMMIRHRQALMKFKFQDARKEVEEAFPKYADTIKSQKLANGLAAVPSLCYNGGRSHG